MPFRLHRAVLAAALVAAAAVPSAAQAANPAPCNGVPLIEDTWEDQVISPGGFGARETAGPVNTDIQQVWLDWKKGTDGKFALTGNIQLAKADLTVPSQQDSQGGLAYYFFYKHGDQVKFVRAHNKSGTAFEYAYGHIQDIGTPAETPEVGAIALFSVYQTDGTTTGKLFEGENGVIQIVIPEAAGGKAGETLGGVTSFADYFLGPDDLAGINNHADAAPDDASVSSPNGVDYKVAACAPPAPAASKATKASRSRAAKLALRRWASRR